MNIQAFLHQPCRKYIFAPDEEPQKNQTGRSQKSGRYIK